MPSETSAKRMETSAKPKTGTCERKRQLLDEVLRVLSQVSELSGSRETAGEIAMTHPVGLEDDFNRVIAEKEKAIAALEQHQHEHGC
jgi:hypothetical protein